MEYNNYLGWIYPKTQDLVNAQDVENIIYLQKGNSGGLASLDGSGKVPTNQLPSYVDDVLEFESKYSFPNRGEEGKIYVDADSNYTYRWTGSTYILIGGLQNLVDGTSTGSVRNVSATQEDGNYSLGQNAFAEGYDTKASGFASHSEGTNTSANDHSAHAEGYNTVADVEYTHAEGMNTTASGYVSHSEGSDTIASGDFSHAEGQNTIASGVSSHASGCYTTAQRKSQTVIGEYNILDVTGTTGTRGDYAFIIGNGTSSTRSNALTVKWDGVVESAGTPSANNHLTTKSYVDTTVSSLFTYFNGSIVNNTLTVTFTYNQVKNILDANKLAFLKYTLTVSESGYESSFTKIKRILGYGTVTSSGATLYYVKLEGDEEEFIASTPTATMTYHVA